MKTVSISAVLSILKSITYKKCPLYVQIQTTPLCNHNCEFCGVIHSFDKKKMLTFNDFRVIRDNLAKLNVGLVVLTGGEPMLREDIARIVRLFSEKGIEVRLQTNGTLLTKGNIEKLNEAKLSGLTISLDSLHEEKQNRFTRANSFKKIIGGILNAVRHGNFNVIALNVVITKNNLGELEDIVRFATDMGVFVSLIPLHNEGGLFSGSELKSDANFFATDDDFKRLKEALDKLTAMKKGGYLIINTYKHLSGIYDFMRHHSYAWKCDSPDLYFSIRPDGTFSPCIEYTTGYTCLDRDFHRTYNSKEFKEGIRRIVGKCKGCYYPCWSEVSFFVSNPLILLERAHQFFRYQFSRPRKDKDYDKILAEHLVYK